MILVTVTCLLVVSKHFFLYFDKYVPYFKCFKYSDIKTLCTGLF